MPFPKFHTLFRLPVLACSLFILTLYLILPVSGYPFYSSQIYGYPPVSAPFFTSPVAPCFAPAYYPPWGAGILPSPSLSGYPLAPSFLPFLSLIPQSLALPGILDIGLLADLTKFFPPAKQAAVVIPTTAGLLKTSPTGGLAGGIMTTLPVASVVLPATSPLLSAVTLPTLVPTPIIAPALLPPAVTPAGFSITSLIPAPPITLLPPAPLLPAPLLPAPLSLTALSAIISTAALPIPLPLPVPVPAPATLIAPALSVPAFPVIPQATASLIALLSAAII